MDDDQVLVVVSAAQLAMAVIGLGPPRGQAQVGGAEPPV
jgi:hypothetical protein